MYVRGVENFGPPTLRLFRTRQRVRFRFGEPACEIQRLRRREWACSYEILADHLFAMIEMNKAISRTMCQLTCPSNPPTSAAATIWVKTEPNVSAPNIVWQLVLGINASQNWTANAGPSLGAAKAANFALARPAWHAAQGSFWKTGLFRIDVNRLMACSRIWEGVADEGRIIGSFVFFWRILYEQNFDIISQGILSSTWDISLGSVNEKGYTKC